MLPWRRPGRGRRRHRSRAGVTVPTQPQRRRRDSRGLIASAARKEFAEFGYAGARVDRIARRAGVNKQLVFYYYRSKAGLYDSVIEGVAGEASISPGQGSAAKHAVERLREAFAGLFDSLARQPDSARLILLDVQRAPGAAASRQVLRRHLGRIREAITEGQGHGYFRDDVDPDRGAQQAVVLALGYFAFEGILEDLPDPTTARAWRDGAADLVLRALAW